jgi:hypothetical protein
MSKGPDVEFYNAMLKIFPVTKSEQKELLITPPTHQKQDSVKEMQASLRPNQVITDEQAQRSRQTLPRPGEQYERHRNVHDLSGRAESYYLNLERVTGLPIKNIVRAVTYVETALQKQGATRKVYQSRQRKRSGARSQVHPHSDLVDPEDMELDDPSDS